MARPRMNPNLPKSKEENVGAVSKWDIDINKNKIPYVSHLPKNPMKMSKVRKDRIRKIVDIKTKEPNVTPEQIAERLKITPTQVKRDLTAAVVLVGENKPYLPAQDKALLRGVITTYNEEAKGLFTKIKTVVQELEDAKTYLEPKAAMSYAMLLGELRQTLELGAKLSGELQTGTRVNVIMFSGMVKRIIEILSQEVDRPTFIRIRQRLKLEMQGQNPLGEKGGPVEIIDNEE